jgi:hypothetical protein
MTTAFVFLFTIALIIGVANTMGTDMLRTFNGLTNAWDDSMVDSFTLSETDIDVRMLTNVPPSANSSNAPIVITNTGNLPLENFAEWDIIMQVTKSNTMDIEYLTFATTAEPADGEWVVQGVYLLADSETAEIAEPNVLNPGEEMVLLVRPTFNFQNKKWQRVSFATPNGVTGSVQFEVSN